VPWPFRRDPAPLGGARRETTAPLEVQPPLYRSPSLGALVSHLTSAPAHHILDLGTAIGTNVEFFSRFSCRLQIVDLPGALATEELQHLLTVDPAAAFRRVLPAADDPFDVVLAWDVLNYLSRDQFRALTAELGRRCRPGALMLAFISTAREMPGSPSVFKIVDGQTLLAQPQTGAVRPSPRFPPAEVERLAAGFAVVQAVRMRHGIQEYLLQRR
jgi:hypothetical protein